jgi:hypothetical protein
MNSEIIKTLEDVLNGVVNKNKITSMIEYLKQDSNIVSEEDAQSLYALAANNYVLFEKINGESYLTISQTEKNYSFNLNKKKCKIGEFCSNLNMYIYHDKRNDSPKYLDLPKVTKLNYYCNCTKKCKCLKLNLPPKIKGEKISIKRNYGKAINLTKKQYKQYVKLPAKYTYNPDCIFKKTMEIDYIQYFCKNMELEKFKSIKYFISNIGNCVIICKDDDNPCKYRVPLIQSIVRQLNFVDYWIYSPDSRNTLEQDCKEIKEIIKNLPFAVNSR